MENVTAVAVLVITWLQQQVGTVPLGKLINTCSVICRVERLLDVTGFTQDPLD